MTKFFRLFKKCLGLGLEKNQLLSDLK